MPPLAPEMWGKDTKNKNLRELLDAEPLGAFSPGLAFVAGLKQKQMKSGWWDAAFVICVLHHLCERKVKHVKPLTGLSSPSSTSSFVKSLRQSLRVTSPEFFWGGTESIALSFNRNTPVRQLDKHPHRSSVCGVFLPVRWVWTGPRMDRRRWSGSHKWCRSESFSAVPRRGLHSGWKMTQHAFILHSQAGTRSSFSTLI